MKHVAIRLEPVFRDAFVTTPRTVTATQRPSSWSV